MGSPDEALGVLLIAIACGVVLGIAALLIVYKVIDKDLPVPHGICALIMIMVVMALAIHPPHPAVPGVVLVVSLSLMVFFPYAVQVVENHELRGIDAERLAKCYAAVAMRPDNFAAKFELANLLHGHGFVTQAITLSNSTFAGISDERDDVKNRSLRDVFHREQVLLKRWQTEPQNTNAVKCPSCGAFNRPTEVFCSGCQQPHLLNVVRGQEVRSRVFAKLLIAWAAIALFIPMAVSVGMNFEGAVRVAAFGGGLAIVGGLIAWLFKSPKHAITYSVE